MIYSNNASILRHFWDIATFTVYVTAYDLEKSFSFNKTAEITGNLHRPIHVYTRRS